MTTRTGAVKALRDLADKIDRDEPIGIEGALFMVPDDDVVLKVKYGEKDDRGKFKISLSWDRPGGLKSAEATSNAIINHYELPDSPPSDSKQLKKEMQHALYYFRRLADDGAVPGSDDIARYRRLQEQFSATAKSSWSQGVDEADVATDELETAAAVSDVAGVSRAIERLLKIKKVYHDRHK